MCESVFWMQIWMDIISAFYFIYSRKRVLMCLRLLLQDTASLSSQKGGVSKHGWLYKGNMNSAISVTMRVSTGTPLKRFTTSSNSVSGVVKGALPRFHAWSSVYSAQEELICLWEHLCNVLWGNVFKEMKRWCHCALQIWKGTLCWSCKEVGI